MPNYFTWLLSHAADIEALLAIEQKLQHDLPSPITLPAMIAYAEAHAADFAQAKNLIAKIAADFPHTAPKPGPLKTTEAWEAEVRNAAVAIGQPGHPFITWILSNGPAIVSFIGSIIPLFGGGVKP